MVQSRKEFDSSSSSESSQSGDKKNLDSNKEKNDKKQVVQKEDEASANSSSGCDISENNEETTSALKKRNTRTKKNSPISDCDSKKVNKEDDDSTGSEQNQRNTRSKKQQSADSSNTKKVDKNNKEDIDDSDSESEEETGGSYSESESEDFVSNLIKRKPKSKPKSKRKLSSSSSSNDESDDKDDSSEDKSPKKVKRSKRKRKKEESPSKNKMSRRREIRNVLKKDQLTEETKDAEKQERERRKRLENLKDNKIVEVDESMNEILPLSITKRLVLQKEPLVEVHPYITIHLKPHQVEGIQFIWDNFIESTEVADSNEGGGCILAHCMGLGKTLQTISVVHTILTNKHLNLKTVLIVAPLNTLLNWIDECCRWIPADQSLQLYNLNEYPSMRSRLDAMKKWKETGGILVLGYDMFRLLASGARIRYKAWKVGFAEHLLDPGPDLIVCDEGHKLKNAESNISVVMSKIKTKRRLVLTGTPLQNNLMEYQCMVNFVKPNLLGSVKEFRNRFVNPIQNGQHSDSTPLDVRLMKKRCHILHNMLQGFVQRKDYTALAKYLCEKHEYIIKVRLTPVQTRLYKQYLDTQTNRGSNPNAIIQGSRDTGLFADYQNLMRIWTHPRVLRLHTIRQEHNQFLNNETSEEQLSTDEDYEETDEEENKEKSPSPSVNGQVIKDSDDEETKPKQPRKKKKLNFSDDSNESASATDEENEDDNSDDSTNDESSEEVTVTTRKRRGGRYRLRGGNDDSDSEGNESKHASDEETPWDNSSWYSSIHKDNVDAFDDIESGGKLSVLFEILHQAKLCDDKVLVFSQSLLSLDLIEEMLTLSTTKCLSFEEANENVEDSYYQKWYKNVDYYRIDGSSLGKTRQRCINQFNDEEDRRARLFLISTKAGSLGVNLVAANRVIIFDASWNPTHDIQSIFRVYRFGQTKACYIYRLIAQGTMEEKIYDRQVTKQSLSFRVVDEQQINRYFTAHDLQELYNFHPLPIPKEGDPEPIHALPKDKLLAELLVGERTKKLIASYHTHDSLLDHQETEELTEEERKAAWEEYEKEKMGYRARPSAAPTTSASSSSSSEMITKLQNFYRNQLMAQQMKAQNQHNSSKQDNSSLLAQIARTSSSYQISRDEIFSMILQVSEAIINTKKKMESLQPLNIQNTVDELRKMPMYTTMKDDALRMIAFEIKLQRHQASSSLQNELNRLQHQMRWLNSKFQSLQSAPPQNTSSAAFNSTKKEEKSLFDVSSFARASFANMLETMKAANPAKHENRSESSNIVAPQDGSDKPVTTSTSMSLFDSKRMKFSVMLNKSDTNEAKAGETATFAIAKSSGKDLTVKKPIVILPKTNITGYSSLKTAQKRNSRPPSSESKKQVKKVEVSESSEDEKIVTDEEDDWEAQYLKKATSRSRRARN